MALTRPYVPNDTRTGTAYPNCYIRISSIVITSKDVVNFGLEWWVNKVWANSGQKVPWKTETLLMEQAFDQSGANPKTQIYTWLKTQSEFSSATDV